MTYNCSHKVPCSSFRDHVLGFGIAAKATPTRGKMAHAAATEERWIKDGEALHRLGKAGFDIPHVDGAAELESKATQPIELQHGKIYGPEKAKMIQEVVDSSVIVPNA